MEDDRPSENDEPSSVPPRYSATTSTRSFAKHKQAPVRAQQNSDNERSVDAEGAPHVDDPAVKQAQRAAQETARAARLTEERRLSIGALRRARLRRLMSRRSTLIALALLVIIISCFAALRSLDVDKPAAVSGHLTQLGAITFTEGAQSEGGISPVCGCEIPPVGEWRGVVFAGRSISLSRSGHAPLTDWLISAPEPDTIRVEGGLKRVELEEFQLGLTHGPFDSRWLLDPATIQQHATIIAHVILKNPQFGFIDHGELHVSLLGPAPIAAWIPFPGSRVALGTIPSAFPTEPSEQRLTERYPPSIGEQARTTATRDQQYPLGDFLGPNVVVWTNDPTAHTAGVSLPAPRSTSPAGDEVVTALRVVSSTFSTTIAALPFASAGMNRWKPKKLIPT